MSKPAAPSPPPDKAQREQALDPFAVDPGAGSGRLRQNRPAHPPLSPPAGRGRGARPGGRHHLHQRRRRRDAPPDSFRTGKSCRLSTNFPSGIRFGARARGQPGRILDGRARPARAAAFAGARLEAARPARPAPHLDDRLLLPRTGPAAAAALRPGRRAGDRRAARGTLSPRGPRNSAQIDQTGSALGAAIEELLLWRDNGWQEMENLLVEMLENRDRWMHGFVLEREPDWEALRERLERPFANAVRAGAHRIEPPSRSGSRRARGSAGTGAVCLRAERRPASSGTGRVGRVSLRSVCRHRRS